MAKQLNIDLGMESDHCCPCPVDPEKTYFPSFHYDGDQQLDLPHEGVMTIRYKKTSSSMREDKRGTHYSCSFDVQEIISAEGKKDTRPSKRDKSAEESLDAHMAAREKESY